MDQTFSEWLRGGTNPPYEGGKEVVPAVKPVLPASWISRHNELDQMYRVDSRMIGVLPLAIHGINTIDAVHHHISARAAAHPALESELRHIEEVVASCVSELIMRYMER
jgi:hypothetical protein